MGDGRVCRIVAVYASVGDGVYGEDMGDRGFGAGMVESRGVCRIREIGGEGKERKRDCGMEKSSNFSMELCWWL